MKVGFVSLGCSKNLVDTEMFIGMFQKQKFEIVNNPQDADIIVVNTCGFITSAKEEAINTILEMADYKNSGKCQYLVATGCLVKRYQKELEKAMPEVDLFISVDDYDIFWDKIEEMLGYEKKSKNVLDYNDRVVATGKTTTYLKIAEGCSNHCTYCAIPAIRGPYISRKMEDILQEANKLAESGYKEIIVIAQDTSKYGIDLYGEAKLPQLLEKLCRIDGIEWIRFLYTYPESITDELINVVKKEKKICKYFDIPLQHVSNNVLKKMNRKSDGNSIQKLIEKLRKEIPEVIIRTTFIVGFPGETEEDFEELLHFMKQAKFEKVGAFSYSKEEGTAASRLPEQIHYKVKQKRYKILMEMQEKISQEKLQKKIGKTYISLVDEILPKENLVIARSYMDIPDEDGVIFVNIKDSKKMPKVGDFIEVKITDVRDYDLVGEIIN